MDIGQVVLLLGGWTIIVPAIFAYIAKNFSNKLIANWENENKKQQIVLQGQIDKIQGLSTHLLSTHSTGYHLAQQKRIEAVQKLWDNILIHRVHGSNIALLYKELPENKLRLVHSNNIQLKEETVKTIAKIDSLNYIDKVYSNDSDLEKIRPFISSELWTLFHLYRRVIALSMYLLNSERENLKASIWKDNKSFVSALSEVFLENETNYILSSEINSLNLVLDLIEIKSLNLMNKILTGETAIESSLEQLKKINLLLPIDHSNSLST